MALKPSHAVVLLLLALSVAQVRADDVTIADVAQAEDWDAVRERIRQRTENLDAAQADGMTALHWAVWHDETEVAMQLLDANASPSTENRYEVTPLSLACTNGNADIVRLLLDAGADANSMLPSGETALMTASRTGAVVAVEALLENKANVNAKERKGQTAIMWAAAEGHSRVVALLLRAGAEYQEPLKSGFTPFFFAVREGHWPVIDVLLATNVGINGTMQPENSGGRAPRRGMSGLMLAIENGHFELAVRLLEAGANPNDQRSGFTPLHAMSWVRKPNRGDGLDGTPPPIGSGNVTSLQCVRALIEHGADVNARLKRGRSGRGHLSQIGATPFLLASDTADLPFMKLLLELGADPTIPNADNGTPLHAAAGIGTRAPGEEAGTQDEAIAAVKLLLELDADINAVDRNGETTMHGAAYASWPLMAHFLAGRGADISIWNRKNRYGWTPLLIAEGHRPGNFKPAAKTIEAVRDVMRTAGVVPPPPTPRKRTNDEYSKKKKTQ